jgi:hypothetical protein
MPARSSTKARKPRMPRSIDQASRVPLCPDSQSRSRWLRPLLLGKHSASLGHVPARSRLAAPFPAGRAGGHVSRVRKAGQYRGRHAIPWLGCGERLALGSGSR